jgi:hypothetical protein
MPFIILFSAIALIPTDDIASGLSISIPDPSDAAADFECLRCRFGATATARATPPTAPAPGPGVDFGGAAAMGTTPLTPPLELAADPW